jgi:hypothetical protein
MKSFHHNQIANHNQIERVAVTQINKIFTKSSAIFICIKAAKIANVIIIFFATIQTTSHHFTSVIFIVFFIKDATVFAKFNQIKTINKAITNLGKKLITESRNSAIEVNHIKFVPAKKKTKNIYHFRKSAEILIGEDSIHAFSKKLLKLIFSKIFFTLSFSKIFKIIFSIKLHSKNQTKIIQIHHKTLGRFSKIFQITQLEFAKITEEISDAC